MEELRLTPDTIGAYLAERGLAGDPAALTIRELGGGVSNIVSLIEGPGIRWVAKQSLGIAVVAYLMFANGASIKWIAVTPGKWSTFDQLIGHFTTHLPQYIAQFLLWLAIFSVSMRIMGHKVNEFIPSFVFIYLLSIVIFMIGAWDQAHHYTLEPPLVALAFPPLLIVALVAFALQGGDQPGIAWRTLRACALGTMGVMFSLATAGKRSFERWRLPATRPFA